MSRNRDAFNVCATSDTGMGQRSPAGIALVSLSKGTRFLAAGGGEDIIVYDIVQVSE